MLNSDPMPITDVSGARSVYLVFYTGRCHLYERISDGSLPVYVGQTKDLSRRIREHVYSLKHARDLRVDDFYVVSERLRMTRDLSISGWTRLDRRLNPDPGNRLLAAGKTAC